MNKFLSFAAGALMLLPMVAGATVVPDACDQQFTYIKQADFTDARVIIDLSSNKKEVSVTAPTGYEILEVWLDVDNDGFAGQKNYANGPITGFNPNPGDEITVIKVVTRKVCTPPPPVDVCADIAGDQATVPAGHHQDGPNCPVDVVVPPPVDVCNNIAGDQATIPAGFHDEAGACIEDTVVPPTDLCPNDAGVQTTTPCPSDTVTPPSPSPEPTPTPSSGGGTQPSGGHRHCDVPGTPTCADYWGNGGASTPSSNLELQINLLGLLNRLVDLLKKKLAMQSSIPDVIWSAKM